MMSLESLSGLLQVLLIVVLPVVILGFMVYVTYRARKANAIKNNKKEK